MRKVPLVLAILCIGLLQNAMGSFKVNSPLFPDRISADFGYIPYGKILSGDMIMGSDFDPFGCKMFQNIKAKGEFLVVKIGECSILQKAYAAQSVKAKMLIVIADHDFIDEIHVLNTGKTDKVTIPVLIFAKTIGDQIIFQLQTKKNKLEAKCFFPRDISKEGPVTLDYWFDPLDSSNYKFFYQFSALHKDLGNDVKLRVHLALSYSQSNSDFKVRTNSCVSNGEYCAHDPDGAGALVGKDVVLTGLAMLCLQNEDSSYTFTKTLHEFDEMCLLLGKNLIYPLQCLKDIAKKNGYKKIDFDAQCFAIHFENGDMQSENKLLKKEKDLFHSETVQIWPELYVNSRAIRGNIQSIEEVESAVCGGYSDPIPSACYDYFEYTDDSIGAGYIILMISLSAIMMFGILFGVFKFYYHRKFKNQIDGEVNSVIQKYMSFNDETDNS